LKSDEHEITSHQNYSFKWGQCTICLVYNLKIAGSIVFSKIMKDLVFVASFGKKLT
jgi:hypothetical protein